MYANAGIYAMNEVMHAHDVNRQRPRYPSIGPIDEEVRMIGRHVLPVMPEHLLISHVAGKFICLFFSLFLEFTLMVHDNVDFSSSFSYKEIKKFKLGFSNFKLCQNFPILTKSCVRLNFTQSIGKLMFYEKCM